LGELVERRALAAEKLEALQARLADAEKLVRRKACVYVTGSFGRNEASAYSDLDLFILGQGRGKQKQHGLRDSKLSNRQLSRLRR
jgi:predicted nucleotidyltransferase